MSDKAFSLLMIRLYRYHIFLITIRIYSEMLSKKGESDRFSKVLQKLNPPTEKP